MMHPERDGLPRGSAAFHDDPPDRARTMKHEQAPDSIDGYRAPTRLGVVVLTLLAAFAVSALGGCASEREAPPEAPAAEEEAAPEPDAAPALPVREEVALVLTGRGEARYTLAINKTTGVSMEQTHRTPVSTLAFPAGETSVARFRFADGRAIEMAVQRPHRLDGGAVQFDGCTLRMNWSLGKDGHVSEPCGRFVELVMPRRLPIHETPDESVALVVERVETPPTAPAAGVERAEVIADEAFATNAWHSDGGEWLFLPSGLSVEPVVQRKSEP